jgi:hypothetical protein
MKALIKVVWQYKSHIPSEGQRGRFKVTDFVYIFDHFYLNAIVKIIS